MAQTGYYDRDRNQRSADGSVHTAPTAAGTMNHTFSHHSNANEYISSGMPFVLTQSVATSTSAQVVTIEFPYVTRWLMMNVYDGIHDGTPLPGTLETTVKVGFGNKDADEGVQMLVNVPDSSNKSGCFVSAYLCTRQRLELKCKKVYVQIPASTGALSIEVIAGLTGVKDFPSQDGAHIAGVTSVNTEGSTTASNGTVTGTTFTIATIA